MQGDGALVLSVADIISCIEQRFPPALAEEWDNVGLQIGADCVTCRTIMTCLTVTEAAVDYATEMGVDLIIAHHPLIFTPLKNIIFKKLPGRIIGKLLTHHISLYVAHTNVDQAPDGLNDWLAEALLLENIEVLEPQAPSSNGVGVGYGRIGQLPSSQGLEGFARFVSKALNINGVRFVGAKDKPIQRVAVSCGSGSHLWSAALQSDADVLVTGDVRYHTAMEVADTPLGLIDAGHFGTEAIFVSRLAECVEKEAKRRQWPIRVVTYDRQYDPWKGV